MQVLDNIEWLKIYWLRGSFPKGRGGNFRYEVKDPPCTGWQHAIVIRGEKRSTIFCPFSLMSFSVTNHCGELQGAKEPTDAWLVSGPLIKERLVKHIKDNWKLMQARGWLRDYDAAAKVLKLLGHSAPEQIIKGGETDTRKKGGKDVGSKLKKPVKLKSKRGKFLKWFMDGENSRPIREAMMEFNMTRSNALSYLFMLQKDHGIGYVLVGDVAEITLPDDCSNPFDVDPDAEDDWLD